MPAPVTHAPIPRHRAHTRTASARTRPPRGPDPDRRRPAPAGRSEVDHGVRALPVRRDGAKLEGSNVHRLARWSVEPEGDERHEGNGRSDAVRLPTRGNLRRVRMRRRGTVSRPTSAHAFDLTVVSGPGARRDTGKLGEPQVRYRAAICPEPVVGGNRRGGAEPRGRSTTPRCGNRGPKDPTARHPLRRRQGRQGPGVDGHGNVGGGAPRRTNPRRGRKHRPSTRAVSATRMEGTGDPLRIGSAEDPIKARRRHVGSHKIRRAL